MNSIINYYNQYIKKQESNYSIFFLIIIYLIILYIFFKSVFLGSYYVVGLSPTILGIHEIGHLLFGILGIQFIHVLGGSLAQIFVPLIGIGGFIKQQDYFGIAVMFAILGVSFFEMSIYARDAIERKLPMFVMGGGDSIPGHDWNYMLGKLGLINNTELIANTIWFTGFICFLLFFLYGGILIRNKLLNISR